MQIRDGMNLNVETRAAGENAPWVVLSNSVLTDLSIWDDQMPVLHGMNVLRYDQRGHGKSDVTSDPLDFDALGRDLIEVMEGAGIRSATFVGLSMGVPTGLAAYARAPERFDRLVFVDGQAVSAPSGAAFWDERIALAQSDGMGEIADANVGRWLKTVKAGDARAVRLRQMMAATPLEGFVAAASALRNYDYSDVLAQISVPLRMIAGSEDGAIPQAMARIGAQVAGSSLVTLPGLGHVPNFEAPDQFNIALLAALA